MRDDTAIIKYINKLRNPFKKVYAIEYYNFISGNTSIKPIYLGKSLMAQQAIEHKILTLWGKLL